MSSTTPSLYTWISCETTSNPTTPNTWNMHTPHLQIHHRMSTIRFQMSHYICMSNSKLCTIMHETRRNYCKFLHVTCTDMTCIKNWIIILPGVYLIAYLHIYPIFVKQNLIISITLKWAIDSWYRLILTIILPRDGMHCIRYENRKVDLNCDLDRWHQLHYVLCTAVHHTTVEFLFNLYYTSLKNQGGNNCSVHRLVSRNNGSSTNSCSCCNWSRPSVRVIHSLHCYR